MFRYAFLSLCAVLVLARPAMAGDAGFFDNLGTPTVAPDVRQILDVPYGDDRLQKIDVYAPQNAKGAPMIVMVHGGGWKRGDKASPRVVNNKVAYFVPKGFIFISANYRMLPTPVDQQAADVAKAVAFVQKNAAKWGGDPARIILMGHSAGAHLVSLLAADPVLQAAAEVRPWRGTVVLDSGGYDIPQVMNRRHMDLYDEAFGSDEDFWARVSPLQKLSGRPFPMLLVCSTLRRDKPCLQAAAFAAAVTARGGNAAVLQQALSHGDINGQLGENKLYTESISQFIDSALQMP